MNFDHVFLRERITTVNGRYIHNNPEVVTALKRFAPDVVVTNGFNPTHLYAFFYAFLKYLVHVPMTDGTDISEQVLSPLHRALRRIVFSKSYAYAFASRGGQRLFQSYGIAPGRCFQSCLCINNEAFSHNADAAEKRFDFIFSGRIEAVKNPLFALEVAAETAKKLQRRISIVFVGSGSLEDRVKEAAARCTGLVHTEFAGFAKQSELPALYQSARVFLFPTNWDPWGIVVNEACASGLPIMVTPAAGVAGELVLDGENGFVCDLNISEWGDRAAMLLTQTELYKRFSERSRSIVANYTFAKAAAGFVAACRHAMSAAGKKKDPPQRTHARVVIVERQLLHYRVALYQRLRNLLKAQGVELQLLIGEGTPAEIKKKNQTSLDWSISIPTRYLLNNRLCWQPFGSYARDADLVVVMHENKLIYNLWLLFFNRPRRLAFWGHGRNMQSDRPDGLKERFKRWTVNKVDWWFAYTESSAALVTNSGFSPARTTVVENAVDTREMMSFCRAVNASQCGQIRTELGLGNGPIGLYLGSLYQEKRLGFLLDAAQRIRKKIPGFQLLVVGAGPEQVLIESAARLHKWVRYLGPLQDEEKARVLVLADVMLNPGLVGLGVLDSFVSGTPMFTTDCGLHSPEISYLVSGKNGVMTADDVEAYAGAVIAALSDPAAIARLQEGALATAPRYTVENMADRICSGILSCLGMRRQ